MFVTIAAITPIVAAVLGSCDKLDLAQNTNTSPESNSGTQTWAAYTLETITPTKPPATNTPTLPPPSQTPTVTPTQTPNPTPTPEIPYLIAQFGLNPDREYTFVITENGTLYLRDEHNQAYMLMYQPLQPGEDPAGHEYWIDTSLEEKYGHLVPENETLHAFREPGYGIDGSAHRNDPDYQNLYLIVRNTGNIHTETVFDPRMGMEVTRLVGQAVYRDRRGGLQIFENLIYRTVDTSQPIFLPRVCAYRPPDTFESLLDIPGFCPEQGVLGITPDQALRPEFMGTPGQPFRIRITYDRPDVRPVFVVSPNPLSSNFNSLATWDLWHENQQLWQEIAAEILRTGVNPHPEVPLGVTWADLYMSLNELNIYGPQYPARSP